MQEIETLKLDSDRDVRSIVTSASSSDCLINENYKLPSDTGSNDLFEDTKSPSPPPPPLPTSAVPVSPPSSTQIEIIETPPSPNQSSEENAEEVEANAADESSA
jgi:hypothetical protein